MRTLEEIASQTANKVYFHCEAIERGENPETSLYYIILSALTEATLESEEQVAELREALEYVFATTPLPK